MPFTLLSFLFSPGKGRMQPPRGFESRLRSLLGRTPQPDEEQYPCAHLIRENASFLYEQYVSLKEALAHSPLLPVQEKEPYLMCVARDVCSHLPLHRGQMLCSLRRAYQDREMKNREIALLPLSLQTALMERVNGCLLKALLPLPEEEALALHRDLADALHALRQLPGIRFDTLTEHLSPVARELQREDTYRQMDRESRQYYLRCAEHIAKKYHLSESAVARAALTLSEGQEGHLGQAGYYLTEQPEQIAAHLHKHAHAKTEKEKTISFLLPLFAGDGLFALCYLLLEAPWFLFPFGLIAFSDLLRHGYYRLLRRIHLPRMLPRLNREQVKGQRLLVVIPTLITGKKQALHMVQQMHLLHAATPHAHFMLLADFADGKEQLTSEEQTLIHITASAVAALNQNTPGTFHYLHRARSWDPGQSAFTGRERKRGALETLNLLLDGQDIQDVFLYTSLPLPQLHHRYDQVITLDADTFLPPGAAAKMQGALMHPLQKGRTAVIQPRMENAASTIRTRLQHLLISPGGCDPYQRLYPNVYQDVFGKGSFAGKGIYDPALFLQRTKGRLPQGRILSHDLIEGEWAHSAMAEDIAFLDSQPGTVAGFQKRLHRWTRGDWQLLPFLWNRELPLLSRFKIYDNLRQSQVALCQSLLLLIGALLGNPFLMVLGLPFPLSGMVKRLMLLPGKAATQVDALFRALYRQFISHKQLLSWVTAHQAEGSSGLPLYCVLSQLVSGTALVAFSLLPTGVALGLLPGILWLSAPLFREYMDREKPAHAPLKPEEEKAVMDLCRDTWHFFEEQVHPFTHFLPPDNVQLQPEKGPALRTSPTNIGLYLLSCLAARELNLITTAQMARRMLRTVETLEALERWHGHFYNWYSLEDKTILPPRFVSTVDSGNLCACLLACAQGARQHLAEMEAEAHSLPGRLDEMARNMDFSRLYDPERSLFHIGCHTEENRLTPNHYDLLASECRLTSFVAVMLRQVPLKHWYALGRKCTRQGGGAALLSFGGTAFEYLMPQLLLPLYENTLLSVGCKNAIRAQMAAAKSRPFGISESGYFAFDPDMNYQYRAFGLPALALSDDTAGPVVAPYASMLALPLFPKAAIRNLKRMRQLGWYSEQGLFEAADYTPHRLETAPRLVQSHMAHHQGMILCAGCNLLTNQALVRHFMAPAAQRAYSFLLCENAPSLPPFSHPLPRPKRAPATHAYARPAGSLFPYDAHALCGHGVTWLMNSRGDGLLKNGDKLWSRFDPAAPTGPRLYLRNSETGAYVLPQKNGQMIFENGCIRIPFTAFSTEGEMRFFVLPLTGEAVMDIKLKNKSGREMQLEVISYLEVALSTWQEDSAHPHFRDLSVRIDPFGEYGLCALRLPREKEEKPIQLLHQVKGRFHALQRQGDKQLFLGREGTLDHPAQLGAPANAVSCRLGAVISPCLSLRAGVYLSPASTCHMQFTFQQVPTAHPAESTLALHDAAALALCRTREEMTLSFLRLDVSALPLYQRMLGSLCFAGQPHQAHVPPPMEAIWRYGLNSALPLCTLYMREKDPALLRHATLAHAYFSAMGIRTQLLILCDEGDNGYQAPLRDAAAAVLSHLPGGGKGITIVSGKKEDADRLKRLSQMYLESGSSLAKQLSSLSLPHAHPASMVIRPIPGDVPPALQYKNTAGGFTEEGDYCIFAPTPAPWHNILMGNRFGTLVCERAILHSFGDNSELGRITRQPMDVFRPDAAEHILLKTEEHFLSLTAGVVYHRPGITEYRGLSGPLKTTVTVFSHRELSLGLRSITVQAEEDMETEIRYTIHFSMGREKCGCYRQQDTVFARTPGRNQVAFAHMEGADIQLLPPVFAYAGNTENLPGEKGSVCCFHLPLSLRAHRPVTLLTLLGQGETESEGLRMIQQVKQQGIQNALQQVRTWWQQRLEGLMIFSAGSHLPLYLNRWLPYQARCARLMARTGPYQTGGAFGFRDQLQDVLCLLHTEPYMARSHILLCAAHQYREGDVQHWWHPPRTGVRTRISDDKLFLPFMAALYAEITGDTTIFEAQVPFLISPPLSENEKDRYETPDVSPETASLLQHCLLAIQSVIYGPQGIPLMQGGDWNDGMNRVEGESVWLGFFLCMVLQKMMPYCEREQADKFRNQRTALLRALENAWTGEWYLRAWYKSGEPLAGPRTRPPRIDLISQAFACLAGAPRDHVREALKHAVDTLYRREQGQVLLLHPPFGPAEEAGYITAYLPGVRENGGQYTHAVPWLVMALCQVGQYERAWEMARDLLPLFHTDTEEKMRIYQKEPYVMCGDVYAGQNPGRGGWSWYTGSAAWLYYVYITVLLGLEKKGDRIRLNPCPGGKEIFTLVYRFGSASYHLTASPDTLFATLDGEKMKDGWVNLQDDRRTHEALFPLRKS